MNKMLSLQDSLSIFFDTCNDVCDMYPKAKQKRLPFPFNNNFSASAFDLVHGGVWGPYSIPTHEGFKYFLSIVDDATRCTWIYLLKAKYEVKGYLISFHKLIQNQFGTNIKSIRFDNGQEFLLTDFYSAHGIILQKSCVYTPQQNSIMERKHQHILSIARAFRIQSNFPLCLSFYFLRFCVFHSL